MWYSARLLYERLFYESPGGDRLAGETLFEEKLVVFRAERQEDIVSKLTARAKNSDDEFKAAAGNWVKWVFREILEIQEVMAHNLDDGTEVYYRWWHDPSERDFEVMRDTQEPPWWLSEADKRPTEGSGAA